MSYLLGTGYFHKEGERDWAEWFAELWCDNLPSQPLPDKVACIGAAGCRSPFDKDPFGPVVDFITMDGNCGHVHQLIGKQEPAKRHKYCGWSASMITLAMLAYTNECDFIYKEQDCLAFGPWVNQLYKEIGTSGVLFGKCRAMPAAQSLFMVKHEFIPLFVGDYLTMPPDSVLLPEQKFAQLHRASPLIYGQFSFGVDRDRPLPASESVWYAQKFTPAELRFLYDRGLISLPPNMPSVKVFSNDNQTA